MKLGRYLLAIVVCLSIWGLPGTTAAAQELRIGIPMISGYTEKDENGYYSGYNYDYMQALAHYAGFKCEYVEGSWEQCMDWLQDGSIDVMPGLVKTADRQQSMEYARLHRAIAKLPEIQKRRLILYYFQGLTYEQIAGMEGCTFQAVAKSVAAAEKRLKNFFGIGG